MGRFLPHQLQDKESRSLRARRLRPAPHPDLRLILPAFAGPPPASFGDHRSVRHSASKIPRAFSSAPPAAVFLAAAWVVAEAAARKEATVQEAPARGSAPRGGSRRRKGSQRMPWVQILGKSYRSCLPAAACMRSTQVDVESFRSSCFFTGLPKYTLRSRSSLWKRF